MNNKHEIIADIIKTLKVKGEKYFDVLSDKSESHLSKLLKVSKLLK